MQVRVWEEGTRFSVRCWSIFAAFLLVASCAFARQIPPQAQPQPQPPDAAVRPAPVDSSGQQNENAPADSDGSHKDRIFSLVPNYDTVTTEKNASLQPMTAGQKFKMATQNTFDPGEFMVTGIIAGVYQAIDEESQLGQGGVGYAKRYGIVFADQAAENYTVGAIFPSLFHQDPRYYRMAEGGFWRRTRYSLTRIVVTRGDSGRSEFNASEILGAASAAAIGNAYHPSEDRTVAGNFSTFGTDILVDTASNVVKEFWPDIEHKLHWKQLPF
jgi:hypothetical protein